MARTSRRKSSSSDWNRNHSQSCQRTQCPSPMTQAQSRSKAGSERGHGHLASPRKGCALQFSVLAAKKNSDLVYLHTLSPRLNTPREPPPCLLLRRKTSGSPDQSARRSSSHVQSIVLYFSTVFVYQLTSAMYMYVGSSSCAAALSCSVSCVLSINLIHCGNEFRNSVPVRTFESPCALSHATCFLEKLAPFPLTRVGS